MKCKIILILILIITLNNRLFPLPWEIVKLDNPAPGYYKFDLTLGYNFYLVDNYGITQYLDSSSNLQTTTFYKQLSNGGWVCNQDRKYLILDADLRIIDSIPYPSTELYSTDPHDILQLRNGHFLLNCMETRIMDLSKIITGGYKDANIMSGVLIETDNTGNIYWTWKSLDHFKITDYSDTNLLRMQSIDFTHINSFDEDNDGNLYVSSRHLDEITKIDKSTGKIIWRLGGTKCPANQFTFINDTIDGFFGFSHQHSVSVLQNGNILLYDNGNLKTNTYSRAVEYKLDTFMKTSEKVWEYRHDPEYYDGVWGSVQRLPNGNSLINWSGTYITEVKPDNSVAFEMNCEIGFYRAWKYIAMMNAVSLFITTNTEYDFNENGNRTDIKILLTSSTGEGITNIEKHYYKPPVAEYSDSNFTEILPYRWVLSSVGLKSIAGKISINLDNLGFQNDFKGLVIYKRDKETIGKFSPLKTTYDSETNEISADFSGFGELVICYRKDIGIETELDHKVENIYPLPVKSYATIDLKDVLLNKINITLFNNFGFEMSNNLKFQQNNPKSLIIDMSGYPNGLYFLNINSLNYNKTFRLLLIHE